MASCEIDDSPLKRRELIRPLAMAVCVVALIVLFRMATGVGFGLDDLSKAEKSVSLGVAFNEHDNLQYNCWPAQSTAGGWRYDNRFTLDDHEPLFFSPFFLGVGTVARLSNLPTSGVMVLAGLLAVLPYGVLFYGASRQLGLTPSESSWGCFFALAHFSLAGAYRWVAPLLAYAIGVDPFQRAVAAAPSSVFPSTAIGYPVIAIAYALLAAVLACSASLSRAAAPKHRVLLAGLLFTLTVLLGLTHLYEPVIVVGAIVGGLSVAKWRGESGGSSWITIVVLVAAAGVVASYHLWMGGQPVWSDVREASLSLPLPRRVWLLTFGAMLPLAGFGCQAIWAKRRSSLYFAIAWLGLLVVALLIVAVPQTKIASGSQIPLALLSGVAFAELGRRRSSAARAVRVSVLCLALIAACGELVWIARSTPQFDPAIARLGTRIEGASKVDRIAVLTDTRSARLLVATTGRCRVFAGNWFKSPHFIARQEQLVRAGVEPAVDKLQLDMLKVQDNLLKLTDLHPFHFALLHELSPADSVARRRWRPVASDGPWRVYAVTSGGTNDKSERD